MNLLTVLLGQIPEAIYFALFMIYTKKLQNKRGMFIGLMIIEYILLFRAFPYSIWARILYFVVAYILLKVLYKEKVQITDIFTLSISSILLMIVSAICYFILNVFITNMILANVVQKMCLFLVLFLLRHKLPNVQKLYKKLWNRNDKIPKIMKSTTFRCINLVVFNIMFYLINCFILFHNLYWR